MEKGWDARGRVAIAWGRLGTRDRLAEATGITPGTLSGYNTGRLPLGIVNAQRIAAATGVSLAELGAPEDTASEDPASRPVLDRLQELEEWHRDHEERFRSFVEAVTGRLARLEGEAPQRARR